MTIYFILISLYNKKAEITNYSGSTGCRRQWSIWASFKPSSNRFRPSSNRFGPSSNRFESSSNRIWPSSNYFRPSSYRDRPNSYCVRPSWAGVQPSWASVESTSTSFPVNQTPKLLQTMFSRKQQIKLLVITNV